MQSDRVRPVWRAGTEHAGFRIRRIAMRMHHEHVAPGTIEPGQQQDLLADPQIPQAGAHARREYQQSRGRACVIFLVRRLIRCCKRRLDPADGMGAVLLLGHAFNLYEIRILVTNLMLQRTVCKRRLCSPAACGTHASAGPLSSIPLPSGSEMYSEGPSPPAPKLTCNSPDGARP